MGNARAIRILCVLFLLPLLMTAGCGGDDDSSAPAATPTETIVPVATSTATAADTATTTAEPTSTPTPEPLVIEKVEDEPVTAAAGQPLAVVVRVRDTGGSGRAGIEVAFRIDRGGGSVEAASVRTDADGLASTQWTLGAAPVRNRLLASIDDGAVELDVRATLDTPLAPTQFGDVDAFMTERGIEGSTEDLAFDGESRMILGVGMPGGLLAVDPVGSVSALALTGDELVNPLGVAFDQQGDLWVADSAGSALRRVSPDGTVTTILTEDGTQPLAAPNYVAVDGAGRIYLSDPCLAELIRFDPMSGEVDAVLTFDLVTQGGPNGFAFDASGERLYIATENTRLFCGHEEVDLIAEIAGLFVVEVSDAGFGPLEAVATNVGLFGDGAAFDAEGNLYVIFDTQMNLALAESAVWVLPEGGSELVKFLSVPDRVLANLAFGQGEFDDETLYISLLAIPLLQLPERGTESIEIGIPGLPVPP
jgi:sugar lactone lactonase YvrE